MESFGLKQVASKSPGGGSDKRAEQDDNQYPIEVLTISKHTPQQVRTPRRAAMSPWYLGYAVSF